MPIWETKTGQDGDDNPRVVCRSLSMQGTLDDFLALGWPKIEKLWVDGNFLSGTLPASLPEAWPSLVSLDLYSNRFTGSIPSSWTSLHWQKLQLNDNLLSGDLPSTFWKSGTCHFSIAANPELGGCIPATMSKRVKALDAKKQIAGTKMRFCSDEL